MLAAPCHQVGGLVLCASAGLAIAISLPLPHGISIPLPHQHKRGVVIKIQCDRACQMQRVPFAKLLFILWLHQLHVLLSKNKLTGAGRVSVIPYGNFI